MNPTGFTQWPVRLLATIPLLILFTSPAVADPDPGAPSSEGTWEATYPAPVLNITQEPWVVQKGENVQVALTLASEAEAPRRLTMIWCRVEPDYVCGQPLLMLQEDTHTWTATIPGSYGRAENVIQEETRHIGYNISLQYATQDENVSTGRYWAPTHNPWTPATFPEDSVGAYYFIALEEAERTPGPTPALFLLLIAALLVLPRFKRNKILEDTQEEGP